MDAIDLLTEKTDFNELDLCLNFNLYYCNQPFIVKLDHFLGYTVRMLKYHLMVYVKLIVMGLRNITLISEFAREKCYYLKIIVLFRGIINRFIKEKNGIRKF